jgi:hypothetical protein
MKNITLLTFGSFLLLLFIFAGCEHKPDSPPPKEIPEGHILTIDDLRQMYKGEPINFSGDSSVYAVVGMAEEEDNLYQNAFVQDATGGIQLRLEFSGGLYEGDSIRIHLDGTTLNEYNNLLQLDSVNVDDNIIKQATNRDVTPQTIKISEIGETYESEIIKLENVQFKKEALGKTYADAENQESKNRTLIDCNDKTIIVRTSGYASFADDTIPSGKGSLIAAVGQFRSTYQLFIRRPEEVNLNDPRCGEGPCDPVTTLSEDFEGTSTGNFIDLNCWTNKAITGTRKWIGDESGSNKFAKATAWNSGETVETWLITPPVEASGSDVLSFQSAMENYKHDGLTVWISTDFDGSDISSASWTEVTSANIAGSSNNDNEWVNSGNIDVSNHGVSSGDTYHVGFKYTGDDPAGDNTDYMIDDVQITQ